MYPTLTRRANEHTDYATPENVVDMRTAGPTGARHLLRPLHYSNHLSPTAGSELPPSGTLSSSAYNLDITQSIGLPAGRQAQRTSASRELRDMATGGMVCAKTHPNPNGSTTPGLPKGFMTDTRGHAPRSPSGTPANLRTDIAANALLDRGFRRTYTAWFSGCSFALAARGGRGVFRTCRDRPGSSRRAGCGGIQKLRFDLR